MADQLPQFFALQFSGKYLRYVVQDGDLHGCLAFSGDELLTPYTRFEVLEADTSKNMVHIRCCYNKKFWRKRSSKEDDYLIVVGANDPEEDQSKSNCTLITPLRGDAANGEVCSFSFASGLSLSPSSKQVSTSEYCYLEAVTPATAAAKEAAAGSFSIINLNDAIVLPRYVVFKGDNGRYLRSKMIEGHQYLEFDHAHEDESVVDPEVRYETFMTSDGNVRIKSLFFDRFLRRDTPNSRNWVWADSTDTSSSNGNTVFQPRRLNDNNMIALRCLGNNLFCIRVPAQDGKWDCLDATSTEPGIAGQIEVEEAVVAREIYDIQFQLNDARISDMTDTQPTIMDAENWDPNNTLPKILGFSVAETQTNTWTSTNSWKVEVSTTISTGIPVIAEGKITTETSYEGSIEWSETVEKSVKYESSVHVNVSPMTKQIVTMLPKKVSSDIPFSYTQRDTLLDGSIRTTRMDDGLYSGVETIVTFTSTSVSLV